MSTTLLSMSKDEEAVGRSTWHRPTTRTVFLGVLLVVLVAYTEMAFQMEWRDAAGRIGAGFFPRLLGGSAVVLTVIGLVRSLRGSAVEEDASADAEHGDGDLGRHPFALVVAVGAGAAFAAVLTGLGAILSSALFMFGMLWFLNRQRMVLNVALSLGLPVGLYLLLQTLLNAGLPPGILPLF